MVSELNATNCKTLFAEIQGRKIAYRSIGNGDPIILCQRFRGNLDDWDPAFLDALSRNYNVITFDYTGFASSTGDAPTNMFLFAKDVVDLAEALNFKKIIVGGWSFGGWVAQIVTTEFPELVSQTVLIGTRAPGSVKYPSEEIFFKLATKPDNDFEDEVILFFEPTSKVSTAAAQESHQRIGERSVDNDIKVRLDLLQFYFKGGTDFQQDPYNAKQKLTETKIPILVVSADHEICFPPENWFELNRKLPTTQIVVIPQSGHGVHHQYPDLVSIYIHSFIEHNKEFSFAN